MQRLVCDYLIDENVTSYEEIIEESGSKIELKNLELEEKKE